MKPSVLASTGALPELWTSPVELWNAARTVWQRILGSARRPARRLRLAETLSLGERRFVAVVEFERARFLVGGTSASLVLLTRLEDRDVNDRRPEDDRAVSLTDRSKAEIASEESL